VALAQSASEIAAAKQWFSDALALEEKKQFAEALTLFKKAMDVKRTPQIVFHVALCELETNALAEALVDFERAVEIAKSEGNDQVESAANAELAKLRPRVPTFVLTVKGDARPNRLTLDDGELALSTLGTSMPVNPGRHRVVAEFDTGKTEKSFQLAERGKVQLELVPPVEAGAPAPAPGPETSPPPVSSPPPASPGPPPPPQADRGSSNVVPWVVLGGGVLVTAGGFYMWKLRNDQKDELDSICPQPDQCPADRASDVDDLQSKGKTYNTLAIGMWGIGVAAIATGSILLFGSNEERTPAATFSPAFAPGVAGGFVSGSF